MEELLRRFVMLKDYPGYAAGSDGSLWSSKCNTSGALEAGGWHQLKVWDHNGYLNATLTRNGKRQTVRVNRVILTAFKGPPPADMKDPAAAHEDNDRYNNAIDNLTWKSRKDNEADKKRHGTAALGERHGQAVLTEELVLAIRKMRADHMTWKDIALAVGQSPSCCRAAGLGINWRHLGGKVEKCRGR